MNLVSPKSSGHESINIYMIGNNPIELSTIYDKLKSIKTKTYHAEIGFDLKRAYKKIMQFNPACILIDDNLEKDYLRNLLRKLSRGARTRNIPITIIKNSNYSSAYLGDVQEFLLKDSITSEGLSSSISNSIRLRAMQKYLYTKYKKKQSQFLSFFANN